MRVELNAGDRTVWQRLAATGAVTVGLAFAYAVAAAVSIALTQKHGGVAGIWIAAAVALGLWTRLRDPGLPVLVAGVLLGSISVNMWNGATPDRIALYGAIAVLDAAIGGLLVGRAPRGWAREAPGAEAYLALILRAGALAAAVSGAVFAGAGFFLYEMPFVATMTRWWGSHTLGFVLVFPILVLSSRAALKAMAIGPHRRMLVTTYAVCVATALVVGEMSQSPFLVLLLPLMLLAAFASVFEMALAATLTGIAFVVATAYGRLPVVMAGEQIFNSGFQMMLAIALTLPMVTALITLSNRQKRNHVAASEERFRRAMEDSVIGMTITELDGRITKSNRAFAEMIGSTVDEVEGRKVADLVADGESQAVEAALGAAARGETDSYRLERIYRRSDGTTMRTLVAGSVIRDVESGRPLYIVCQIEDIDARRRAEQAVQEAEMRWHFALESAGQGVWDCNLRTGKTYYSPTWKRMLGYSDHELPDDADLWLKLIHPDDRPRVDAADKAQAAGLTPHFEAEFRIRHKQGHWIWVLDRGRTIERDAEGRAIRAIGTYTDITRHKESEARLAASASALRREKDRLRVTLESIGDAVICTDGRNHVTFMNRAAQLLTGFDSADALGRPLATVYAPIDEETGKRIEPFSDLRASMTASPTSRAMLVRPDGSRRSIREIVSPLPAETGNPEGWVIVFQDFTDARTLQRELAHAAAHDMMTGLANRSHFVAQLADHAAMLAPGQESQLLYIDLDRFKHVNDSAGHAAGDALLIEVAKRLRNAAGPLAIVGRLGGDEFAILLKQATAREAKAVADLVCATLAALPFQWQSRTYRIGASIGVTVVGMADGEPDLVLARADEACYAAKKAGRGQAVVYQPGQGTEAA